MKECCGTCKYHERDFWYNENWLCVNERSEYCADYTEDDGSCYEWEGKE